MLAGSLLGGGSLRIGADMTHTELIIIELRDFILDTVLFILMK